MDFLNLKQNESKELVTLQLAPIIDVFIVIIIFLILGSFSKGIAVQVPDLFRLAKTFSDSHLEISSEVFLDKNTVNFNFISKKMPINEVYHLLNGENPASRDLRSSIQSYIKAMKLEQKVNGVNLNFVIDEGTQFQSVFDLTQFLKNNGFENISYITQREYDSH